jgi:glycosyltransferase involved in cell wall biosynthesis
VHIRIIKVLRPSITTGDEVVTRALIVHHRWGYGGGEAVFYYTIKALADAGFDVTISTTDPPDPRSYLDVVGEPLPGSAKFVRALNIDVRMLTIYKALMSWKYAYKGSFDVIVVTHGYPYILGGEVKAPIVYYMHFPIVLIADRFWNPEVTRYELKGPLSSGFKSFVASIPWWLYFQPYRLLAGRLYRRLVESISRVLVNSNYTLNALKYSLLRYTDLDLEGVKEFLSRTRILHPPLPRAWELLKLRGGLKVACVVSIGRFSSEKRYDLVLDVARLIPEITFIVAGGVYGRASRAYYQWVRSRAPGNVVVKANIPAHVKNLILSKCTVYLHTMVGEHFGISPLEALAAGMTPVVPEKSGTWTDVCNNGEYCYGYRRPEPKEIAEAVEKALEKPLGAPREHVERFSPRRFIKGVVAVVEEVLGERSG